MSNRIAETDDGTHALVDGEGRIQTLTNESGQLTSAHGFEKAADLEKAAKESGIDLGSRSSGKSSGKPKSSSSGSGSGATRAAKARGARRS